MLVLGVLLFAPRGIFPDALSSTVMAGAFPLGRKALVLAILGCVACLSGAAVETALSGGYNLCQFFNLPRGKSQSPRSVRTFTVTWILMFTVAMLISALGVKPLTLINVSIILGMVVLPFTYGPILLTAADKNMMGTHVNSRLITIAGAIFLVLITVSSAAAIPLMIVTHSGKP